MALEGRRILLIIAGGIAAYKSLDLIRRLRERGAAVRCILTAGGAQFVTPLAVASLSEDRVFSDLFSLTDESEMGHIRLSREADLVVVAPATADLMAKVANGFADDLASTALLATDKPVLMAPTMNVRMWDHAAVRRNAETLLGDGVRMVGPGAGDLACGEVGSGRMAEVPDIVKAVEECLAAPSADRDPQPLAGLRALVTSGPTREPIDPVRYIANRSSGKQGHAVAAALARAGADVTLVAGPVHEPDPPQTRVVRVESAREMLAACEAALPVDVAVCAAAVADWRPEAVGAEKLKKAASAGAPQLRLVENPDILRTLAKLGGRRPRLLIGFAAETQTVVENAIAKRAAKGCDWILANDVSAAAGTFGGDRNRIHLVRGGADGAVEVEDWPLLTKREVAERLASRVAAHFAAEPVREVAE
jgi:phosphopantothenoylcysteine decarboxylase / phosphopantothenate---cysteine ligase